jgi:uncharacterized Zn-finger protein
MEESEEELLIIQDEEEEELVQQQLSSQSQKVKESSSNCRWEDCSFVSMLPGATDLPEHINEEHIKPRKIHSCEWIGCTRKGIPLASKFALISHVRKHTGEKPFICPAPVAACGKTFSRSDALAKHVKVHHPELEEQFLLTSPRKKAKSEEKGELAESLALAAFVEPAPPTYYRTPEEVCKHHENSEGALRILTAYERYLQREKAALGAVLEKLQMKEKRLGIERDVLLKSLSR